MTDIINFESILRFMDSIKGLASSLLSLFAQCFGWLGPEILLTIGAGVVIAIVLRFLGR